MSCEKTSPLGRAEETELLNKLWALVCHLSHSFREQGKRLSLDLVLV